MDPDSRAWLDGLSSADDRRERKIAELLNLTRAAAQREVTRRPGWASRIGRRDRDELVEEIASDAVLLVVSKLDKYRGRSRFTTWAYAFVMNVASEKLARNPRRPLPQAMQDQDWARLPDRQSPDPHHSAALREVLCALQSGVERELTERQRRVFVAAALNSVSIDELAEQLHSNRNAIYKNLFDARRKLRAHLEVAGYRV